MPDKAPVSVILPTYNRAATISRAIISVLNQYPQPLELIVVDDGSYDDTRNVIESLAAQQIRYLQLPQNVGAHVARNAGILAARGDFIAFQDSDDELMPGFIQEHLNAFKRCKKADVSVVCAVRLSPTGVQRPIPKRSRLNLECCGDFSNHLMGGSFIGAPMMMIKRSVLIDVGMFDEQRTHLMEDWELAIRLSQVATFAFSQRTLHIAYDGNDNINRVSSIKQAQAISSVIVKHYGLFKKQPEKLALQHFIISLHYLSESENALAFSHLKKAICAGSIPPISYSSICKLTISTPYGPYA